MLKQKIKLSNSTSKSNAVESNMWYILLLFTLFLSTGLSASVDIYSDALKDRGNMALAVNCPSDKNQPTDLSSCSSVVAVDPPTVDDLGALSSIINDINGTGDASGIFPIGTTLISWTITDTSGIDYYCYQNITVYDGENPSISCLLDQVVSVDDDCLFEIPDYVLSLFYSDNCDNDLTLTQTPPQGTFISETTTINITAQDFTGNETTCSFIITLEDQTATTIDCSADLQLNNDLGICGAFVNIIVPEISDNCNSWTVTNDYNNSSDASDNYPIGITVITWTVIDNNGNTNFCIQNIEVLDIEAPIIVLSGDILVPNILGTCAADVVIDQPNISDNCSISSIVNDYNNSDNASDSYPIGITTIIWTATDIYGNNSSSLQLVEVIDNENPVINCLADQAMESNASCENILVDYTSIITISDNCDIDLTIVQNPIGGSTISGTTLVTISATDDFGNESICSFNVSLNDITPPVIDCSENIQSFTDLGFCEAYVNVIPPVISDNCGTSSLTNDYTGTNDASGIYPIGTTIINWVVTDISNNSNSCVQSIIVVDNESPSITCPGEQIETLDLNCEFELPDYTSLVFTSDNCSSTLTLTQDPPQGTFINTNTLVTITAEDNYLNSSFCTFNIILQDNTLPEINCSADISINNDPGLCGANININAPLVNDNCNILSIVNDFNNTDDASDFYPVGSTTIIWTLSDTANNISTCTQNIVVIDNEVPVINCPTDLIANTDFGICETSITISTPITSDNCIVASIINDYNNTDNASGIYPIGETIISWTVTDIHGNFSTCTQLIEIIDNENPEINCPEDIIVQSDENCQFEIIDYTSLVSATDNCDTELDLVQSPAVGTFVSTSALITITAYDDEGNFSSCSFNLTINDGTDPTLLCEDPLPVSNDLGTCNAFVVISQPVSNDNCGVFSVTNDYNLTDNASDIYPVGITLVTWTVIDINGNSTTCSQNIQVVDLENPTIICPDNISTSNDLGLCSAFMNIPIPDVLDNCAILTIVNDQNLGGNASGVYPIGITIITWTVTDIYGNNDQCTQEIEVIDNENPEINCPEDIIVQSDENCQFEILDYTSLVGATDNCDIDLDLVQSPAAGTFVSTSALITITAYDDEGNFSSCSFNLTINDETDPTLFCEDPLPVSNDLENCNAFVVISQPVSDDNCGVFSITNDYNLTDNASDIYPVGITVVTWTATDFNGNSTTCSQNIQVVDLENPTIICPDNISTSNDLGLCSAFVNIPIPDVLDNCAIQNIVNDQNLGGNASDVYPIGITIITWTVTDIYGNNDQCTQEIEVIDNENPEINCPEDIIVQSDENCQFEIIDYTSLVGATDNCDTDLDLVQSPAVGTFVSTSALITITAYDDEGNFSSCSFNLTINDEIDPTLLCEDPLPISNDLGNCSAFVVIDQPVSDDNCGIFSITNDYNFTDDASDIYPVGITVVTWTVIDFNGNSTTCSQNIEVIDQENPTIVCPDDISTSNDLGLCSAFVNIPIPDVLDNCAVLTVINDQNLGGDASGVYPVGITIITWTVTDIYGNSNQCTQEIEVIDNDAPSIICLSDQIIDVDENCEFQLLDYTIGLITDDNCDSDLTISQTPIPGTNISESTEITIYVEDDFGNVTTCVFMVAPEDNTDPIFTTCQSDTIIYLNESCEYSIIDFTNLIQVSDNCDSDLTLTQNPETGTIIFGHNTTQMIEILAEDDSGNSTVCQFNITVLDTIAPAIICGDAITSNSDSNECGANLLILPPSVIEECSSVTLTNSYVTLVDEYAFYPIGNTTLIWTVSDLNGNSAVCEQEIIVLDDLTPLIFCTDDIDINAIEGECMAYVVIIPALLFDYCGIDTLVNDYNGTGDATDIYPIGTTEVYWTVTDNNGNESSCLQNITVVDLVFPLISCGADYSMTLESGCEEFITLDSPIVSDDCEVDYFTNNYNNTDIGTDFYSGGTTEIVWTVFDTYGNASSCIQVVELIDTISPIILCEEIITYAIVDEDIYPDPIDFIIEATDNCEIDYGTLISTPEFFDINSVGLNNVLVEVQDVNGNQTSCIVVVEILDDEYPFAFCQPNVDLYLDEFGIGILDPLDLDNGSFDNNEIVSYETNIDTYYCSDIEEINVAQLIITDDLGLQSTCQVIINVIDTIGPTMYCHDTLIYLDEFGFGTLQADMIDDGSFDLCTEIFLESDPSNLDCSFLGSSEITLIGTDIYGNQNTCISIVTVLDTINPNIISCTGINQFASADTTCGDWLNISQIELPEIDENCQITSIQSDFFNDYFGYDVNFISFTDNAFFYPLMDEALVWIIEDQSGNITECTSSFSMTDQTSPTMEVEEEILIILAADECFTSFTYFVDESQVSDNCEVDFYIDIQTQDYLEIGEAANAYYALDVNGNEIDVFIIQSLYTIDTIAPIINCQDTVFYYSNIENCTLDIIFEPEISDLEPCPQNLGFSESYTENIGVGYIEYSWEVIDLEIQAMIDSVNIPLVVNEFGQAVFSDTLIFDYISTCTQIIAVFDTLPPVVLTGTETLEFYSDSGGIDIEIDIPLVSDNCEVSNISSNYTGTDNLLDSTSLDLFFEIGFYQFFWEFEDIYGNITYDTTDLYLIDDGSPIFIDCVDTVELYYNSLCEYNVPDFSDFFEIFDEADDEITIEQSISAGTTLGDEINFTVTAIDEFGNSADCNFLLFGIDTLAPEIFFSDTLYLCPDLSLFEFPVYSDNCGSVTTDSITIDGTSYEFWSEIQSYTLTEEMLVTFYLSDDQQNSSSFEVLLIPFMEIFEWNEIPSEICDGDSFTLDTNSNDYEWNTTLESTIESGVYNANLNGLGTSTDTITLEVCNQEFSQNILVIKPPTPILSSDEEICSSEPIMINTSVDEYSSFTWSVDQGIVNIIDPNSLNLEIWTDIIDFDTMTVDMTLEISNLSCSTTSTIEIIVYETLNSNSIDAGDDIVLFDQFSTFISGIYDGPGISYWEFPDIISSTFEILFPEELETEIIGMELGDFEVNLIAENGVCPEISDTLALHISEFIPNGFSPDDDGVDDFFVIPGLESHEIRQLIVFNTWGSEVYSSDNYNNDWNGTNNSGNKLAEDVYYYILRIDKLVFTDFVIIKRN